MGWNEPVINRSNSQYQNAEDYSRVEENTQYLLEKAKALGYLSDVVQNNKTDWGDDNIDSLQQHLRIINNIIQVEFINLPGIKILRTDLDVYPPTSQDYNDWEQNLKIIHEYAISSLKGIRRLSFRLGGGKLAT